MSGSMFERPQMRLVCSLTCVAALLAGCGIETASNSLDDPIGVTTSDQREAIYQAFNEYPNGAQISIALIRDGIAHFYGLERINDALVRVDNSGRVFEVGSVSKVFTSALLAMYVVDGKIGLEDPIGPYLGIGENDDSTVSFLELANHTSGLTRMPDFDLAEAAFPSSPYLYYDENRTTSLLRSQLAQLERGEHVYSYSNFGAGVLGFALSRMGGASYEELVQQEIFSVYGMGNSGVTNVDVPDFLVRGLDPDGSSAPNWSLKVLAGAGGIYSSAEDLASFVLAHFDRENKSLALTRMETTATDIEWPVGTMGVGLGLHLIHTEGGETWFFHNGGTRGYKASMTFDPEQRNGIVILANVRFESGVDELGFYLMRSLSERSRQ